MRRGFTMLDVLVVVAALVIVLGLMVSLARYVRSSSSEQLTERLLADLDRALHRYEAAHAGKPPTLPVLLAGEETADEVTLRQRATQNNRAWVRALSGELLHEARPDVGAIADPLGELPVWLYDEVSLRDAWGTPIVLMPRGHARIGMDAEDRAFFLSAGPDRRFLTRQDNLYSYETRGLGGGPR